MQFKREPLSEQEIIMVLGNEWQVCLDHEFAKAELLVTCFAHA